MTRRNGKAEIPPHDADAEQSVIGSILMDPQLLDCIADVLKPDDFHLPHAGRVYAEMLVMRREGIPIDSTLLLRRLDDAGATEKIVTPALMAEMVECVPTASNAGWYADVVARKAEQRRAWMLGHKLAALGQDDYRASRDYPNWRAEIEATPNIIFRPVIGRTDGGISTAAELMRETLPEPKWAIPDLLPEGLAILAGKPKFGKSWLMLAISCAVVCGGRALGKISVQRGSVLYLGLEDSKRRMQKRLAKMLCGEPAPASFHYALSWQRTDEGGVDRIRNWLEAHDDARLIVVDTLKKIRPKRHRNANLYDEDYEAAMPLKVLADEFGVCVICVTHTRKAKADDIIDEVSGTLGLAACADSIIVAKRGTAGQNGSLFITGRDIEEKTLGLTWHARDCLWELVGEVEDKPTISLERQRIINVLTSELPALVGPKLVAERLGYAEKHEQDAVRVLMHKMAEDQQIAVVVRGKYTVATPVT